MGQPTQHHRFRFASAVVSVSARGAAAPRTGAGELHRQCFASVDQCAGAQIGPRLACASCWISRRLWRGLAAVVFGAVVAHARYVQTLRFYIRPHFAKRSPVATLKLRLVSPTASRPHGFPKQVLCKVAFAGERARQPSALPVRIRALRAASHAPLWLSGTVALVRRCALCFCQWPAASHVVSAPPLAAMPLRGSCELCGRGINQLFGLSHQL